MAEVILEKPIQNPKETPYLDWIKSGKKKFEGRLMMKIKEWNLEIGKKIKFYDQDDKTSFVIVEVTGLPIFTSFETAFDALGETLIPGRTREEVIEMYNNLFHYPDKILEPGKSSKMILDNGVVAIGFNLIKNV